MVKCLIEADHVEGIHVAMRNTSWCRAYDEPSLSILTCIRRFCAWEVSVVELSQHHVAHEIILGILTIKFVIAHITFRVSTSFAIDGLGRLFLRLLLIHHSFIMFPFTQSNNKNCWLILHLKYPMTCFPTYFFACDNSDKLTDFLLQKGGNQGGDKISKVSCLC